MKRFSIWSVLALLLVSACVQAADENPFKNCKVGDWVAYAAKSGLMKMKQTVIAKTEKSVTLRIDTEAGGQTFSQETVIDLDKPYEAANMSKMPNNAKSEKLGEGTETISIAGKDYKCKWIEHKTTMEMQGQKIESTSKVWTSPDVPLTTMVRMVSSVMGNETVLELTGSGTGGK